MVKTTPRTTTPILTHIHVIVPILVIITVNLESFITKSFASGFACNLFLILLLMLPMSYVTQKLSES